MFLGSALVALGLLAVGAALGILHQDSPEWTWVSAILMVDVAHVYSTGFRVYFDTAELRRRPLLYFGTPAIAFALAWAAYLQGHLFFWRALAYVAVFHFVRQQYGWVALYRAKAGERDRLGKWIDTVAVYAATVYPLLHWHVHMPRRYVWFTPTDFPQAPAWLLPVATPLYWTVLAAYAIKSMHAWTAGRPHPGKDIVVATTAVCWYVGIITFNSDYAFTVTNVIIHGVPYMVLVYVYWRRRTAPPANGTRNTLKAVVIFLATIWLLAYLEELWWHRAVWGNREWLFGEPIESGAWKQFLVPLLAVPQLTHYLLDGFIWRRRKNPEVAELTTHGLPEV